MPALAAESTIGTMNLTKNLRYALDRAELFRDAVCGEPDDWQSRLLASEAKRIVINASRQSGKSKTCAILCAHEICFPSTPDGSPSLVVAVAPSLRQSTELCRSIFDAVRIVEPDVKMQSLTRLETTSGSRCIALPQSENIRGLSRVSLAAVDECARVDSAMMAAVRPMLSVSNGRLVLMLTPFGKLGAFWEAWSGASGGEWEKYSALASANPRISKEFLDEERKALGPFLFSQEWECQFLEPESAMFSDELIKNGLEDYPYLRL